MREKLTSLIGLDAPKDEIIDVIMDIYIDKICSVITIGFFIGGIFGIITMSFIVK